MFPRPALILPFAAAITTQYKSRTHAGISSQFHVAVAVTHHPTRLQIDVEVSARAMNQTSPWFSAVAVEPVRWFAYRRMMSAVINCIELRICSMQFFRKSRMNLENNVFRKVATRDARLISY